jgi:hypothetical protein
VHEFATLGVLSEIFPIEKEGCARLYTHVITDKYGEVVTNYDDTRFNSLQATTLVEEATQLADDRVESVAEAAAEDLRLVGIVGKSLIVSIFVDD